MLSLALVSEDSLELSELELELESELELEDVSDDDEDDDDDVLEDESVGVIAASVTVHVTTAVTEPRNASL